MTKFISEVIPQTEKLRDCSEDRLSAAGEYVMQLLEDSSVYSVEIVGNHRGDLGRPIYHVEKEELQEGFSISTIPVKKLHQYLMSQKKQF